MGGQVGSESAGAWRKLQLRYPGTCDQCGARLDVGATAWHNRSLRKVRCPACREAPESEAAGSVSAGEAGRSANRQYERRAERHRREIQADIEEDSAWRQKVKAEHPILGRVAAALTAKPVDQPPSRSVKAWKKGAEGEQAVGRLLDEWAGKGAGRALHDRRIGRTKANIDHLAVNAEGVWVIDTKNYKGLVKVTLGIVGPQELTVDGRNQTELVRGVRWQMDQVAHALDTASGGEARPAVYGVLCFANAEWGLLDGTSTIKGVTVAWPKATIKLLSPKDKFTQPEELDRWARVLSRLFPPA